MGGDAGRIGAAGEAYAGIKKGLVRPLLGCPLGADQVGAGVGKSPLDTGLGTDGDIVFSRLISGI